MRKRYRRILILACAAALIFSAGCGMPGEKSAEPPSETTAPDPTPHVHLWEDGVCSECGEECVHAWTDGVCRICGMICEHKWKGGVCTICAERCSHVWNGRTCSLCGMRCAHRWENGVCAICGEPCTHRWKDGKCQICGTICEHDWVDSICMICGWGCEHQWADGVCQVCGTVCLHESHDAHTCLCDTCGVKVPHEYYNGLCFRCGVEPPFVTKMLDLPKEIKTATGEKGTLKTYHYSMGEGKLLIGEHGMEYPEERKQRDVVVYTPYGYDPAKQYNVLVLAPGAGHNAHQWMEWTNLLSTELGRLKGCDFLDRLIAAGKIEPLIVVVAEYYLSGEPEDIAEVYEKDIRERVLPFIAAHYSTYASVTEDGTFIPSPEHFGFIGASFGAMVGWHMLPTSTDLFSYWSFLSGCYQAQEEEEMTEKINSCVDPEHPIQWLFAGDGKLTQGWTVYRERMKRLDENSACVQTGKNLSFISIERGMHSMSTWDAGLYNTLQIFFHNHFAPTLAGIPTPVVPRWVSSSEKPGS